MAYTENQMTHVKIQNSRWETKIFEMEDLCSTDRKCQLFFPEGIYTESSNGKGYADCNSYDDHLFPDEFLEPRVQGEGSDVEFAVISDYILQDESNVGKSCSDSVNSGHTLEQFPILQVLYSLQLLVACLQCWSCRKIFVTLHLKISSRKIFHPKRTLVNAIITPTNVNIMKASCIHEKKESSRALYST